MDVHKGSNFVHSTESDNEIPPWMLGSAFTHSYRITTTQAANLNLVKIPATYNLYCPFLAVLVKTVAVLLCITHTVLK